VAKSRSSDALVAAVLLGFAQGAEYDFLAYLTARYFGMAHYGRIYGRIVIPIIIATAVGAFGVGYPGTCSARSMRCCRSSAAVRAGALSMLALGRYPRCVRAARPRQRRSHA
jgi:MFS transporter, OFA family, oxalate/formate antiporter